MGDEDRAKMIDAASKFSIGALLAVGICYIAFVLGSRLLDIVEKQHDEGSAALIATLMKIEASNEKRISVQERWIENEDKRVNAIEHLTTSIDAQTQMLRKMLEDRCVEGVD